MHKAQMQILNDRARGGSVFAQTRAAGMAHIARRPAQANISVLPRISTDVSSPLSALAMNVHEGGSNA
ncbi:hypothetical protein [Ensifer adhaerens]|uniref:hypothetical protein n=1 Tax=Ensifer adhaerens TaxID=106592 RepID=UPI00128F962B|nr:hypothetical protein [Ensifer adhaerens]